MAAISSATALGPLKAIATSAMRYTTRCAVMASYASSCPSSSSKPPLAASLTRIVDNVKDASSQSIYNRDTVVPYIGRD